MATTGTEVCKGSYDKNWLAGVIAAGGGGGEDKLLASRVLDAGRRPVAAPSRGAAASTLATRGVLTCATSLSSEDEDGLRGRLAAGGPTGLDPSAACAEAGATEGASATPACVACSATASGDGGEATASESGGIGSDGGAGSATSAAGGAEDGDEVPGAGARASAGGDGAREEGGDGGLLTAISNGAGSTSIESSCPADDVGATPLWLVHRPLYS